MRFSAVDFLGSWLGSTLDATVCGGEYYCKAMGDLPMLHGVSSMDADPTLFTDRAEAEVEAHCRLVAMETAHAIRHLAADGIPLKGARKVQVLGEDGRVLFESDLR